MTPMTGGMVWRGKSGSRRQASRDWGVPGEVTTAYVRLGIGNDVGRSTRACFFTALDDEGLRVFEGDDAALGAVDMVEVLLDEAEAGFVRLFAAQAAAAVHVGFFKTFFQFLHGLVLQHRAGG